MVPFHIHSDSCPPAGLQTLAKQKVLAVLGTQGKAKKITNVRNFASALFLGFKWLTVPLLGCFS
jgi:hypothetical protein